MMKRYALALAVLCLGMVATAQTANPDYQDGKIWVKLKSQSIAFGLRHEEIRADEVPAFRKLNKKYQLLKLKPAFESITGSSPLTNVYLLKFGNYAQADALIRELAANREIEYAEKVPLDRISLTPNDPAYNTQWWLSQINAPAAWNYFSTGGTSVIAIVDDAVETSHTDLSDNLWYNPLEIPNNNLDDDNNGYVDDINGYDFASNDNNPNPPSGSFSHGTHVAGIASASTNNANGIASIGFSNKLMCIKTTNIPNTITDGYSGIVYAANNGADIINVSWGSSVFSITAQNVVNYAHSKGCIIVGAAGNENSLIPNYPAAYPGVVSVAATDVNDAKASFSNYGTWVSICAPGNSIYSTMYGNSYGYMSGTSMAAPMVAGLLGLMHSYNPGVPNNALISCLQSTATNIYPQNISYNNQLGSGRINALGAMQCIQATLSLPPVADFTVNFSILSAGGSAQFTNLATYGPTTCTWLFPGGTPSSYTGTTPPPVVYNSSGVYPVTLIATNNNGSDTETKVNYITVNAAGGCYSINYPTPTNWTNYTSNISDTSAYAYANGLNFLVPPARQKAMYFDASATPYTKLTKTYIKFFYAGSNNPNKTVPIRVYDGTSGVPGALLGSSFLNMATIKYDADISSFSTATFTTPVTLPASKKFFVSVDMINLSYPTDTLGILSNSNGQTVPSAIWEQFFNGVWQQYGTVGSWLLNASLYVHPVLTSQPAIATFTASASTICSGGTVSFNAAGSTYEDSLSWSIPSGTPSFVSGNLAPTILFNNSGPQTVTLSIKGGGCHEVKTLTTTIMVIPSPTVNVIAQEDTLCTGENTVITASGANSYSWQPASSLNVPVGSTVIATPSVTTTYTVTGTSGMCSRSVLTTIEVLPTMTPSVMLTYNNTTPGATIFTALAANAGVNPTFQFRVNGVPVQTGASNVWTGTALSFTDTVTCRMTVAGPCFTTDTVFSNAINVDSYPLDIHLLSFQGSALQNHNALNWVNALSDDDARFDIERSSDGRNFSTIGTVTTNDKRRTTGGDCYLFHDKDPMPVAHYRLHILEAGSSEYSSVVTLKRAVTTAVSWNVWPNPNTSGHNLYFQVIGNLLNAGTIHVTELTGKRVLSQSVPVVKGSYRTEIKTSGLAAGMYFIQYVTNDGAVIGNAERVAIQ